MKNFIIFFLFVFTASILSARNKVPLNQKTPGGEKDISSNWTFNYFPGEKEDKGYEGVGYNDSRWPVVSLPHTWMLYETTGELFPFVNQGSDEQDSYWRDGWGWYRKHFTVNKSYTNNRIFIVISGINEYYKIWINGKLLGAGKNVQGSLCFDITDMQKPGEDNVVALAVNNRDCAMKDSAINNKFSGITGNVSVILKSRIYFTIPLTGAENQDQSGPQVKGNNGTVTISARVKNDLPVKKKVLLQTTIRDAYGKVMEVIKTSAEINAGQSYKFEQKGKPIRNFRVATADKPYAYQVRMDVLDGNETVDSWTAPSGLKFGYTSEKAEPGDWFLAGIEDAFKIKALNDVGINESQGEPSKIMLTSGGSLKADKGSMALVTASVVDKNNNPVTILNKTLKWSIAGPGTLVGPSFYDSYPPESVANKGAWGGAIPASNVIRSSGKAGTIRVYVTAAGLASGSTTIQTIAINPDNSVISEPVPDDEGRQPVKTKKMINSRLDEVPEEITPADADINFSSAERGKFTLSLREYIIKGNPGTDTTSVEFREFIRILNHHLLNNEGKITAIDYNFDAGNYNNSRLISGYINATKLPPFFKEGLRQYYARKIISEGNQKNAGEEMNWLNWIPSGGTVVISGAGKSVQLPKGTIVTQAEELGDIISVVHPAFLKYSDEARERAISFISKMNPYVHPDTNNRFIAEKGQPVLIPLIKFITE